MDEEKKLEVYNETIPLLFKRLETDENGLSKKEVDKRIAKYGLNELPKKKKDSIFKIFFRQFINSITIIMILACVLSFLIHEITDGITIIFIILVFVI